MKIFYIFILISCFLLSCQAQQATTPAEVNQMVMSALDTTTDPCADFYQFSCGGWIAANSPLPPSVSSVDKAFTSIADYNNGILRAILDDPSSGPLFQFNEACLNRAAINELGFDPASPDFSAAASVDSLPSFLSTAAELSLKGYQAILWQFGVSANAMQPTVNVFQLAQGGLSLPYAGLYTATDNATLQLQQQYVAYIQSLFQLAGIPASSSLAYANSVFAVELKIAGFTLPPTDLFDPFVAYNNFTAPQLQALMPDLPLYSYFNVLIAMDAPPLSVLDAPTFFSSLSALLGQLSPQDLSRYLMFKVLNTAAPLLSDPFAELYFSFYGGVLSGKEAMPELWETCLEFANLALPYPLGSAYVKVAFPPSAVQLATQMVGAIEAAFTQDLQTVDWMDNVTRGRALEKHAQLLTLIGYPSNPPNYSSVQISGSSFWDNMVNCGTFQTQLELSRLGTAVDRTLWEMPPQTVNAYYEPTLNDLVMIAGILQQPYFDPSQVYPLAMQLGGAGVIAGHESTHSMDSEGADYNGEGELTDWWEPQTRQAFNARVQCVIDQYDQYEVLPGVYVNGALTQGENVADLGGVHNAYNALATMLGEQMNQTSGVVPKFTNAQLFFVAYAQGWCAVTRPEAVLQQINTDPHSPPKYRVIGPLQDSYAFADAFNCPANSYMNPPNKCQVW